MVKAGSVEENPSSSKASKKASSLVPCHHSAQIEFRVTEILFLSFSVNQQTDPSTNDDEQVRIGFWLTEKRLESR